MTTYAVDASKYTSLSWRPDGLGLVIVQSHPADYGQGRSLQLMRLCRDSGVPWDAYIYQYLAYQDWLPAALETLDLAKAEGLVPRKLWLDVEDVDSGQNWAPVQRIAAVERDLALCDQWLLNNGLLPNTAIYSAAWYWRPYMANTLQFADRQLWAAQYDGVADASVFTPFGGWTSCRVKQYLGSQPDGTDLNVLSVDEEAELNGGGGSEDPVTDEERQQMQSTINGLVSSLGYIAGDLLAPVAPQKSNTKAVANLVAGIRQQADQHGISHA